MPRTRDGPTTIADLLALPEDGLRHELLDGAHVVTPAPAYIHQAVHSALFAELLRALDGTSGYEVLSGPADIILGPRTLVQPDLFVARVHAKRRPRTWKDLGVPVLVVEILSATSAIRDRGAKRRIYQEVGVTEYWIVDLDARLVERWKPPDRRPEIVDDALAFALPGGAVGRIDLPILFRKLLSE